MKFAFAFAGAFMIVSGAQALTGCAAMKDAQLTAEHAIDGPSVREFSWGRIECGHGEVCSEVEVARVDVNGTSGGPIEITLKNRTRESVAVQIGLETFEGSIDDGKRTDRTGFHDVALAPRGKSVLTLWQELERDEKLLITLRARSES